VLENLTHSIFAEYLGTVFQLRYSPDHSMKVELVQVTVVPAAGRLSAGRREPFSLIFRAPGGFHVPQRIYPLEHEKLGTLEIFLVPIGPDESGMRYEAVFN
jgi:hypothetical protein